MSKGQVGTIYLLHFDKPYLHAKHYLGWTSSIEERLEQHRSGRGSPLVKAAGAFVLARVWVGDRHLERRLHNRKDSPKMCPICRHQNGEEV